MSPYLSQSVCPSPVAVLISSAGHRRTAMTLSQFSEVSHHPTSLWVCVAESTLTHELVSESGRFSLCVLHEGQSAIAMQCGLVSGREKDKCAALPLYEADEAGWWYLDGAIASLRCRVTSRHVLSGGHTLFLADILAATVDTGARRRRHLLTVDLG